MLVPVPNIFPVTLFDITSGKYLNILAIMGFHLASFLASYLTLYLTCLGIPSDMYHSVIKRGNGKST